MMSISASAPSSARRLLSVYSCVLRFRVCCFTLRLSLKLTKSQYRLTTLFTVAMTCCLKVRSEMCNWFLAIRMARLLTFTPNPLSRFWVIEKLKEPESTGLKSLLGEFCLYPNVLPMPSETLVPVRNPCWMPKLVPFCDVTRKLVPVTKELVCGDVWCWNCALTKTVGSRFGMAEPDNWTLRPLSTPPEPPPEPPLLEGPSALTAPSTPREADDGPVEMLLLTLRSNCPALARCRLDCWSLGVRRATSISRLFSRANAMASRNDR